MFRPAVARRAFTTTTRARSAAQTAAKKITEDGAFLEKGAKRDPELYVLAAIMAGAFGLAGFYFGRKPTSATSETNVAIAQDSKPWQTESAGSGKDDFKYQYHPGADLRNPPKDAPSAMGSVIIPNVNLPKELHERYNKWGKDGY